MKSRISVKDAKRSMYEGIVVPPLLYGSEVRAASSEDRRRIGVMEMKLPRARCGGGIMDRVRNEEVRTRCDSELSIGERTDINVLRWYSHVERKKEAEWLKECIEQR
jgi:hypothetical protein